jgi:hypothetical protein
LTVGEGLIVYVKVTGTALQPAEVAFNVIVPVVAVATFAAVKLGIFPEPLAPSPIAVFELVHVGVTVGVTVTVVATTVEFAHAVTFVIGEIIGVGFIVIVKLIGVPTQLFKVGVTVIVPVIGAAPLFVPVKEAIFPDPLAPSPIAVFEFVQDVVAPTGVEVKLTTGVAPPHCEILVTAVKTGLGNIVIVKVMGVPAQPAAVGVTVIVATKFVEPVFVAVKAGKFPVPLAAKPIAVFEFVQAYVVPTIFEEKAIAGNAPGH